MWYVYFLELSNHTLYIGSTNDLRRRLKSHQNGEAAASRRFLPAALKSYIAVSDRLAARRLERYLKSGSGKAFAKKRLLAVGETVGPPPAPRAGLWAP